MQKNVKKIIEEYQQSLLPSVKKYIKNKSLLDIGCGNGFNSFFFNKKFGTKITLLDVEDIRDEEVLCFPFFESSLEKLPFEQNSFDVIFIQYVLHHLPPEINLKEVFDELKRVGKIVIIVEEISTDKTDVEKAMEFDSIVNENLHPSSNNMHVYKYYTDTELKTFFANSQMHIVEEKILDEGCEDDGFLQRKIYILE